VSDSGTTPARRPLAHGEVALSGSECPANAEIETPRRSGAFLGYYREERYATQAWEGCLRHEFARLGPVESGLTGARLAHDWRTTGARRLPACRDEAALYGRDSVGSAEEARPSCSRFSSKAAVWIAPISVDYLRFRAGADERDIDRVRVSNQRPDRTCLSQFGSSCLAVVAP
jgi:hypothetical protein